MLFRSSKICMWYNHRLWKFIFLLMYWCCIHRGQVNPFVGTSIGLCDCLPLFVLAAPWLQRSSVSLPSWHSAFESPTFRHRYTHRHRHRHRQRTQTKTPILWVTFILRFAFFYSFIECLGYTYKGVFLWLGPLKKLQVMKSCSWLGQVYQG